ncbi:MAG: hypothetical protein PVJ57_03645 [Phycisphaerae bacterium]|jgi:hypothetical protein
MASQQRTVDIRELFLSLQKQMQARLETNRCHITHPGSKGDATEQCWRDMLGDYLPHRYQVEKAFVVDCEGGLSEQIDAVIIDRQYSPPLFCQDGEKFVPAESVYAAFEIKQELTRDYILYAGQKVASVRRLRRTSAQITHAGGTFKPRSPFPIIGGIVALASSWNPPLDGPFRSALCELARDEQLDIGCVLQAGGFECSWDGGDCEVRVSESGDALITFFLRLLSRLQGLGTVPAMDLEEYERALSLRGPKVE